MKKNMGNIDRVIRVVVAVLFVALYITGTLKGTIGLILLILGIVFFITSLIGFCPLYTLFNINTCAHKNNG